MTNAADLSNHLAQFKGRRVVCIGDVMVDRFIYGEVRRISPEAPVPVVRITNEFSQLGGAGNVARNAVALGASVAFFSVIGSDRAGREVTGLLSEMALIEPFLRVNSDRETTIKNRFFSSNGHHLLRADREQTDPITDADEDDLMNALKREVAQADTVLLSDYGKGVVTDSFAKRIITLARSEGKLIVVDPKGNDFTRYRGATVITPNKTELSIVSGQSVETDEALISATKALMNSSGVDAILVTRSADGMTLVQNNGHIDHLNAESHEVADVTGAGDTVVATLGVALAAGVNLLDASRLANAAAGLVVMRRGTAVVQTSEIASALLRRDLTVAEAKVTDTVTAETHASMWRAEGKTVGFTNGCFDLLHPGHVSLLAQAKSNCDKLIVGLNSDASVARLKGPRRPVQNEAARATVLASMENVDLVVVFGEDTPLGLIQAIRPDVLIKGADYVKQDIVGAKDVESYGGRVVRAELVDSVSTTATIAALQER
ncbi:MAG: D-glycero-beta-D-manno-heptose-7-phosphate kinase [Rhodospirillaceae bacterium]